MLQGTQVQGTGPGGEDSVVDLARLAELLGEGQPAELLDHLNLFQTYFPDTLQRILAARADGGCAPLVAPLHAAKGAAATACAVRLQALLQEAEARARSNDWAGTSSLIDAVAEEFERVCAFIERMRGRSA